MDRFSSIVFLVFAVVTFLLRRYDMAVANLVTAIGFAIFDYRFYMIVKFKLPQHWERKLKLLGNIIGYSGIAALIVIISFRLLKISL